MDIPEEYRGYYEHFSNKFASEDLWTVLPSNDEYYFLAAIKRELPENQNQNQIFKLATDYNIPLSTLAEFKANLKLDWLTNEDHQNIIRLKEDGFLDESIIQNLEERGFINQLSTHEKSFLKLIDSKDLNINTDEFEYLYKKYEISSTRISNLTAKNSHLDILTTNETNWLKDGARVENSGDFELSETDFWKVKHRINYYSKNEIKNIDSTNLNPNELAYITAIKDGKATSELKEINKILNLDKETLFLINKRVEHYSGDEIKDINYSTITDLNTKYRLKPHVRYFESKELIQERSKRPVSYKLKNHISDSYLLISDHDSITNEFNRNDFERMSELKAHNKTINDVIVPSNQELAFLENIKWRKIKLSPPKTKEIEILQKKEELFKKIANDDFKIDEKHFYELLNNGFINIYLDNDKRPSTAWREPKSLNDARIYLSMENKLIMHHRK